MNKCKYIIYSNFRILFLILFSIGNLLINESIYCQEDFATQTVASPKVSSLMSSCDFPINPFTGTVDISIPIIQINEGGINLPLSISYNATGIKVEDVPSEVGSGWNINADGIIGVKTRGIPDFSLNGFSQTGPQVKRMVLNGILDYISDNSIPDRNPGNYYGMYWYDNWAHTVLDDSNLLGEDRELLCMMVNNQFDGESDIYTVNSPNLSFKFYINNSMEYKTLKHSNSKINKKSTGWEIIDNKGVKYIFKLMETHQNEFGSFTPVCWFIDSIIDNRGNYVKYFHSPYYTKNYTVSQTIYKTLNVEGYYIPPISDLNPKWTYHYISTYHLDSIKTSSGTRILFNAKYDRYDHEYEPRLESIKVFNCENTLVREVVFLNDEYFEGIVSQPFPWEIQTFPNSASYKRLKLNGLIIDSETYSFDYIEGKLPSRYSLDQDLWGYYNEGNNSMFVPNYFEEVEGQYLLFEGANRLVNPNVNQYNTLYSIQYPTGGNTIFEYECNEVYDKLGKGIEATLEIENKFLYAEMHIGVNNMCTNPVYSPEINYNYGSTPLHFYIEAFLSPPANWKDNCYISLVDTETLGQIYEQPIFLDNSNSSNIVEWEIPSNAAPNPGKYYLKFCGQQNLYFHLRINWKGPLIDVSNLDKFVNKRVGGLRIKTLKKTTNCKDFEVKRYYYNRFDNHGFSSGAIINYPSHYRQYNTIHSFNYPLPDGCVLNIGFGTHKMLTSYSTSSIELNGELNIGYSNVIEEYGSQNKNGKIEYTYTNTEDFPDIYPDSIIGNPLRPKTSRGFHRGLLIFENIYETVNETSYKLIRSIENKYKMHSNWFDHQSRCVNITSENRLHSVNKAIPPCTIIPIGEKNPIWRPYITMTGWSILDSTIKTDYVNDNSVIREYISYNYTNPEETGNLLQISKKIQNSIGETLIKNTIFPYHFKNIANDEYGIYNLQQKHIVDEQIEVSTFLLKHNQMHLIDAVNYCYDEELGIVKSINKLHNSGALTDFKPAHSTNGKVIFDSRYQNIL